MSDTTNTPNRTNSPQSAPEPWWFSAAAYVLLVVVVIGLIYAVFWGGQTTPPSGIETARALQKVGEMDFQPAKPAETAHEPKTGEQVYQALCSTCHATGVTGAPKFGNAADWGPRIATGQQTLEQAPIKGFTGKVGTMPPQSGGQFSDYEIMRAVVYMANAGGAKFEEPPAPAADAASATAAPAQAASQ